VSRRNCTQRSLCVVLRPVPRATAVVLFPIPGSKAHAWCRIAIRWKEAADRWRLEGCKLPEYDSAGRIFTCNNDFSQRVHVRLNGATSQLRELLPQLVRTIPDEAGLPISQLVNRLEPVECDPPKLPRSDNFYIT